MSQKPNSEHHEGQESVDCFESGHHSDFKIQARLEVSQFLIQILAADAAI
jgi:hypothetical protein